MYDERDYWGDSPERDERERREEEAEREAERDEMLARERAEEDAYIDPETADPEIDLVEIADGWAATVTRTRRGERRAA